MLPRVTKHGRPEIVLTRADTHQGRWDRLSRTRGQNMQVSPSKASLNAAGSAGSLRIQAHNGTQPSAAPHTAVPHTPPHHLLVSTSSSPPSHDVSRRQAKISTNISVRSSPPTSPGSRVSSSASPPAIQNPYPNSPPPQRYFRNALREAQGGRQIPRTLDQRFRQMSRSLWNNFARMKAALSPAQPRALVVPVRDTRFSGVTCSREITAYFHAMLSHGLATGSAHMC